MKLSNVKDSAHVDESEKYVIKINVYKRDLEFPDIVFQPISFLFELSRFVSPTTSFSGIFDPTNPSPAKSFADVLQNVRTYDFDANLGLKAQQLGNIASADPILTSSQYDFLSSDQKSEIIRNHVVSLLLSQYVKILTGVDLDEQAYLLVPENEQSVNTLINDATLKRVIDRHVKHVAGLSSFDSSKDSIDSLGLKQTTLSKLIHDLKHLGALAFSRTTMSDAVTEINRALTPKVFERIFNIPIDPDDYLIDENPTQTTDFGKSAFKQLITTGRIVQNPDGTHSLNPDNKKFGVVALEQFFVTIETVLASEV